MKVTEQNSSGNSGTCVVFCLAMSKLPAILAVFLSLTACEDPAPCAADDAAEGSTSDGGGSSESSGGEPAAACVDYLGQCWCDGEVVQYTATDSGCFCGSTQVAQDSCTPEYCSVRETNGDQFCSCVGDFQGPPHAEFPDDIPGVDALCFCGQTPARGAVVNGGCVCGMDFLDPVMCAQWDGFSCVFDGADFAPKVVGGVCACGLTPLDPSFCEGG